MRTVLVTGFGPFGRERDNPSGAIAESLDGREVAGARIFGRVLPVATDRVASVLATTLDDVAPDIVIVTGVAPGRTAPAVERVAVNVRDFSISDVEGRSPVDEPVITDGPTAYLSTLPLKAILQAWRTAAMPGYVSNTAGTYVCNQVFYLARHLVGPGTPCGLLHIPNAAENVSLGSPPAPSLPLAFIERAVVLAVATTLTHRGADLPIKAGEVN